MKKLFIYLIPALLVTVLPSCEEFLDKRSYTGQDRDVLTTPGGIEALLNGVYDIMQGDEYYGRDLMAYEAAKGLDFFVRSSSGSRFEVECKYSESTSSSGFAAAMWLTLYKAIRTATDVIDAVDDVRGMGAEQLCRVEGEARALRALTYFDLMRLFAYPPRFSFPEGAEYNAGAEPGAYRWGVPILEDLDMANNIFAYEVTRAEAVTVYRYVERDLLRAKELLEGAAPRQGHVNYVAVCGLLARLYLYMERFDDAIEQGKEALRAAEGTYRMIGYNSYKTSYYQSFNTENIWEFVYTVSDNNADDSLNYLVRRPTYNNVGAENDGMVSQAVGYAAFGLFPATVTLLQSNPDDVRGYLVCDLGIAAKPSYRGYRKYVGESYHYVYDQPVIRLPEIHLTLAEAWLRCATPSVGNAEGYYNTVHQARTGVAASLGDDPESALAEVLLERRKELMLEGHTYWDYFRRGETLRRPTTMECANKQTIAFGYGSGKSGARAQVVYPIPLVELEANADIRTQQNPGYASYDEVYQGK